MNNKYLIVTCLLFAIAIGISSCGTPAIAQTESETQLRTLNVTGSGKAYLAPDLVYISIGVHTEDKDAAKAVASNNSQTIKVSQALKEFEIETKDIQTTNISIYPQQQYDESGKLQGILYVVDNNMHVTLRDIDKVGDLLNAVIEAGANTINGIQFDVSDRTKAISEARKEAITNAQMQAKEIASVMGVNLGNVQYISVFGGYPTPVFEGKGGGGGSLIAVDVPVASGQMVLTVEVNVTYLIQ